MRVGDLKTFPYSKKGSSPKSLGALAACGGKGDVYLTLEPYL